MKLSRSALFALCMAVIVLVSLATIWPTVKKSNQGIYKAGISADNDRAVMRAQKVFRERQALGEDFSDGPCLTNDLLPNWVVDIAHNPRQPSDDLAANQCQALLEGRAQHFVELDLKGNVIRVK